MTAPESLEEVLDRWQRGFRDAVQRVAAAVDPPSALAAILARGREQEHARTRALQHFSDDELKTFGRMAVERIDKQTGAAGATAAPESPTTTGRSKDMNDRTKRYPPMSLKAGQVITRHPDHPERTGEWTVTGRHYIGDLVSVEYTTADGADGVFALDPVCQVQVRVTAAELRQHAARVLAEIIVRPGLPEVFTWTIRQDGEIEAQLFACVQEAPVRADLTRFAEVLDLPATVATDPFNPHAMRIAVAGMYRQVRIEAWSSYDIGQPAESEGATP